jgi:hypothetical protein
MKHLIKLIWINYLDKVFCHWLVWLCCLATKESLPQEQSENQTGELGFVVLFLWFSSLVLCI